LTPDTSDAGSEKTVGRDGRKKSGHSFTLGQKTLAEDAERDEWGKKCFNSGAKRTGYGCRFGVSAGAAESHFIAAGVLDVSSQGIRSSTATNNCCATSTLDSNESAS